MKKITSTWVLLNQSDGKFYVNGDELEGLKIVGNYAITNFIVKSDNKVWLFIQEK